MTLSSSKRRPDARSFRSRITWAAALFAVFVLGVLVTLVGGAAAATAVPLGTADSFAVLAGSGITNTGATTQVNMINGAQSCNVFWQVGSSATLGTGSSFRGTILALTSITVTTGVTVDGRMLARNGAVTLDTDTITRPCATPTPTTATTPTATTPKYGP